MARNNKIVKENKYDKNKPDLTTMTFASKVVTLRRNKEMFYKYLEDDHPHDFYLFNELTQVFNRSLASPVPAYATHGETHFLSPIIKWRKLAEL